MNKIAISILAIIFMTGCKINPKNDHESTPQIPVFTVKYSNTIFNNNKVAEIQAIKNVEIRSRIKGYLENILVDEGRVVRKGQPLFKLSSPEYTAEFTKAEAALARAEAEEKASNLEVERVNMLVEKNVVAKTEKVLAESKTQVAKAAVAEARASLKNAEAFLAYTTLVAPFDGVLNRIPLKIGSLVNEGELLTSISDISSVYAYFYLPETEYLKYLQAKQKGDSIPNEQNIQLILADGSSYKHKGVIETVAGEIDAKTGAIAFRAKFPNSENLLKHGASGTIRLETTIENAILIPQKSVLEIQDRNYVFTLDTSNVVKMQKVELGRRIGQNYLLLSGVSVDDRIVYEGVQILRDGDKVNPVNKSFQ